VLKYEKGPIQKGGKRKEAPFTLRNRRGRERLTVLLILVQQRKHCQKVAAGKPTKEKKIPLKTLGPAGRKKSLFPEGEKRWGGQSPFEDNLQRGGGASPPRKGKKEPTPSQPALSANYWGGLRRGGERGKKTSSNPSYKRVLGLPKDVERKRRRKAFHLTRKGGKKKKKTVCVPLSCRRGKGGKKMKVDFPFKEWWGGEGKSCLVVVRAQGMKKKREREKPQSETKAKGGGKSILSLTPIRQGGGGGERVLSLLPQGKGVERAPYSYGTNRPEEKEGGRGV